MPEIAVKFWYVFGVFGLEEGTDPEDINDATRDRVVDELYGILWRSHVLAPPSNMPTVVNGRNTFPDESGADDGSEDSEEELGYDADESMDVESLDESFDVDRSLDGEVDGEAMDDAGDGETMDGRGRQGEDWIV